MRLFIAINLPEEERGRLDREVRVLRAARLPVRWVASDALHLTLKFLGEVPDGRVGEVERAMTGVAAQCAPFRLELGGLGAFPNPRNPRVVWVGVQAPPELARLAAALEDVMAELGFPRENRPVSPHLTLGRAERDARAGDFRALAALAAEFRFRAEVEARSADLMRSHLSARGARYERLLAAPLAGAGSGSDETKSGYSTP